MAVRRRQTVKKRKMMTENNFQKKAIRERMAFTGEAYSVAARQLKHMDTWVTSPWRSLDSLMGRMDPHGVFLLTSRPQIGKTTAGLAYALHFAKNGGTAYYASLELTKSETLLRFTAAGSGVSHQAIASETLTLEDKLKVEQFKSSFKGEIVVDDRYSLIDQIMNEVTSLASNGNLKAVIIDYLQLVNSGEDTTKTSVSFTRDKIMHKLQVLASTLEIPIIVLSQLNRNSELKNGSLDIARLLSASGTFVESCQAVIALDRGSKDNQLSLHVIKNRSGKTGSTFLEVNRETLCITSVRQKH